MMMADTLEALGIPREQYVVRVNNRKILDGVMEVIGLSGPDNAGRRLAVFRAMDKLDKFGVEGVKLLLGAGRKDESGDFTKGAGLGESAIASICEILEFIGIIQFMDGTNSPTIDSLLKSKFIANPTFSNGVDELKQISDLVSAAGYDIWRIKIDPSVVRGLEYYTGPVFEAELLFETVNDKGEPARFGSVGGGGRYDELVGRFRSEPVPATGFSIGVSRLMAALAALDKISVEPEIGPVVVTVFDRDRMGDYQKMVKALRDAGIRAELYLGGSGPKAQLKYADKRNSPCVIIQGGDEKAKGVIQVKDLALGKEMSAGIADNAAWREGRPAQQEVPEADLIATVRAIVERRS
jgi:histidyl-tRNA synthetase